MFTISSMLPLINVLSVDCAQIYDLAADIESGADLGSIASLSFEMLFVYMSTLLSIHKGGRAMGIPHMQTQSGHSPNSFRLRSCCLNPKTREKQQRGKPQNMKEVALGLKLAPQQVPCGLPERSFCDTK